MAAFFGDGEFVGEGGPLLQRLWTVWPWKAIRGCPGRYTARRPARDVAPRALLDLLGPAAREVRVRRLPAAAARCGEVLVAEFPGGGGLLTYPNADGSYVHTFNVASGMERKLAALGLSSSSPSLV